MAQIIEEKPCSFLGILLCGIKCSKTDGDMSKTYRSQLKWTCTSTGQIWDNLATQIIIMLINYNIFNPWYI